MYFILILILLLISAGFVFYGIKTKKVVLPIIGAIIGIISIIFFALLYLWGHYLWFDAVGYLQRFKIELIAKILLTITGFVFGFVFVGLFNLFHKGNPLFKLLGGILAAFIGARWGYANWQTILLYINRVNTEVTDPILKMPTSFYLFALPFYESIYGFLLLLSVISLAALLLSGFMNERIQNNNVFIRRFEFEGDEKNNKYFRTLFVNMGIVFILLGIGRYLQGFELLNSQRGAVHGIGWTDHKILLPAYTLLAVILVIFGLLIIFSPIKSVKNKIAQKYNTSPLIGIFGYAAGFVVISALVWFLGLAVLPGIVQWIRVKPNEITFEKPYIENNIEYTRRGYKLHIVEEKQFPAKTELSQQMIENNQTIFKNIRLWDWRALDLVYKQFQEIRLYYEFFDVDIDRYTINGSYRQAMVSAREMQTSNLPTRSQTFVNKRFKYTYGYGMRFNRQIRHSKTISMPQAAKTSKRPQSSLKNCKIIYSN